VGDGGIQLLPFGALIDAQGRFLAERWVVSLAPSVTVALERPASGAAAAPSFFGAAVPEARLWPGGSGRELPALPGTEAEVRAAATAYGAKSTLLVGGEAREGAVRGAAHDASVLHLAAHGYFDTANPLESGLLLVDAPAPAASDDDGVVHAWEVMANWRLSETRLVVLSACDTGLGRELADEGLVGLTRAFEYAGARNVVGDAVADHRSHDSAVDGEAARRVSPAAPRPRPRCARRSSS
jgi:CHAT domain-containing protein